MIGLVIVTHGDLGAALFNAMEHVVGPQTRSSIIAIGPSDDMKARRQEIADAAYANDVGDGVIIVTDLFGGTPSNLAISCMSKRIEVIAGVNLPMSIRFDSARKKEPLAVAAESLRDAGRKYISRAADILGYYDSSKDDEGIEYDETPNDVAQEELSALEGEFEKLRSMLGTQPRPLISHGGIGHNLPPPDFTIEDDQVLKDAMVASVVASEELSKKLPNTKVLQLCIAALRRVLSLLKQLTLWVAGKGDLFATEAAKSTGKALGPAFIAASTAVALSGKVSELIDYLRAFIGL